MSADVDAHVPGTETVERAVADVGRRLRAYVLIAAACILLLCFAVYLLRTPERRVVTWLNTLPEFQSSSRGFPNARSAERNRLLDRILDRDDKDFDYERWRRTASNIPDVHKILVDMLTSHDSRVDLADVIVGMECLGLGDSFPNYSRLWILLPIKSVIGPSMPCP